MTDRAAALAVTGALVASVAAAWLVTRPRPVPEVRATLSVTGALAGDTAGYARARDPHAFRFPEDHGAHPRFRNEWWYLTGNLEAPGGRRIGYQLTLFRSALSPRPPQSGSAWSTNQAWMGHLALTDPAGAGFRTFERFSRGALGLAGAVGSPMRVWVEDWEIRAEREEEGPVPGFPAVLQAAEDDVALELRLEAARPVVLHGEGGLHRKDPSGESASYYYSVTRLRTTGTVQVEGERLTVEGTSWLDREWSTTGLPEGVEGWDWMGLQLDDGRDLMLYRLRRARGGEELRGGTLVERDGGAVSLGAEAVRLRVLDHWRSPLDGTRYPFRWRVEVPGSGLELEIRPVHEAQELNLSYRYWEGAVDVRTPGDVGGGDSKLGRGYLEMTGYGSDTGPRASGPKGDSLYSP